MLTMGYKLRIKYIITGKLKGIENGNSDSFQLFSETILEDITPKKRVLAKIIHHEYPAVSFERSLEIIRPDSVVIWSVTDISGGKKEFSNKNGRTGFIQMRTIVTDNLLRSVIENL